MNKTQENSEFSVSRKSNGFSMTTKISMVVFLLLGLATGAYAVTTTGYKLFTAVSHFNVVENIQVQYFETADGNWYDLPVVGGEINFGQAEISAGETNSFKLRAKNNASNGVLDLKLVMGDAIGLSHDVSCVGAESTGLRYTKTNDLEYHFQAIAGADWKAIQVDTTADGAIVVGSLTFNNDLYRNNALSSYDNICP